MTFGRFLADRLTGTVDVPGSKHFTQRYVLMSAFSGMPVKIRNTSGSEDENVSIEIAREAGSRILQYGDSLEIIPGKECPPNLFAGESATTFRILLGLLSARKCTTSVRMDESLRRRDSAPLMNALMSRGVVFSRTPDGIDIDARNFTPGEVNVSADLSSQFVTSLLMLQSLSGGDSRKVNVTGKMVSSGYVDITISCLKDFGIQVSVKDGSYSVRGEVRPPDHEVEIETDMSSLSALVTLGVLFPLSGIVIRGIKSSGIQPDHIYTQMLRDAGFAADYTGNSELRASYSESRKKQIVVDAASNPDLATIASVIGIFSPAGVSILNSDRLAGKESDRKSSIVDLATAFGCDTRVEGANITINPPGKMVRPKKLEFRDHRMVMAAIVACLVAGYDTRIGDLNAIKKSFPQFIEKLQSLGIRVETENSSEK